MAYMPDGWTLPQVDDWNRAFFTTGKLMVQHCTDCDRVQHPLQRRGVADLAAHRAGLVDPVEHLEQMPVRALVLVDRHQTGKASSG